jgi:serine phosphatase RsbU (regulator of sigma subunit)
VRCAADQSIEELPAGGTVIGLFPESSYEERTLDLQPGDVLLAFTDDLLRRSAHLPVGEMAAAITLELKNWISNAAQYDDLTFILLKVNPDVKLQEHRQECLCYVAQAFLPVFRR